MHSKADIQANITTALAMSVDSTAECASNNTIELTSTVEGVRVGQIVLQQLTEGGLSLLRERVEKLHSKADIHANITTALAMSHNYTVEGVCNKTLTELASTIEGVQLALQQVTGEVKGGLSLLRERVEELNSKADIQNNITTALAMSEEFTAKCCNNNMKLLGALTRNQQEQHISSLMYTHLSNVPFVISKSCQQLAEDFPSAPSGYYWVRGHDGSPASSYCIITSQQKPASSCQQLAQDHPQGESGYYWVRNGTNSTINSYCIITSQQKPASSCQQLAQDHPQGDSGYYWVRNGTNSTINSYCIITSQHNPASSCQQLAQDHPQGDSGYYWVKNGTNSTINHYCIITSQQNPASSCQQLAQDHPQGASGYYWVRNGTNSTINSYCIITSQQNPASSCQQLAQDHPQGDSGYYWVRDGTGQPIKVYCDTERHCCNSTGGWVRVAYVDMTDPNQECPSGFHDRTYLGVRTCGITSNYSPISTTFPTHGIEYSRVCGRIRAYQFGWTRSFFAYYNFRHFTIDNYYVWGVSITHGTRPRKHIWTFAAAESEYYSDKRVCPCTRTDRNYTGAVPPFIGEDYFCDTAATERSRLSLFYPNDPLRDGQGCGPTSSCCYFNNPPWFCKQLPYSSTNDIELRMCGISHQQTPFDHVEFYIQ